MEQNYLKKFNFSFLIFYGSLLQAQSFGQSLKFVLPYVAGAILFVVILVNIGLLIRGKNERKLGLKYILFTAIALSVIVALVNYIL